MMTQEPLFFAHANGFPSETYAQILKGLRAHYTVHALSRIGHNPRYPITDGWPYLVEEWLDFVRAQKAPPAYAVGHSLGGVLVFYGAVLAPELFKGVLILEAPLMSYWRALGFQCLKKLRLSRLVTPGLGTLQRRIWFPNPEEALSHFQNKAAFSQFDKEALKDYIRFGFVPYQQGISLYFDPKVENKIYDTLPHSYFTWKTRLRTPGYFLYGKKSNIVTSGDLRSIQRHTLLSVLPVEGGHLFPFEHPQETLQKMLAALQAM